MLAKQWQTCFLTGKMGSASPGSSPPIQYHYQKKPTKQLQWSSDRNLTLCSRVGGWWRHSVTVNTLVSIDEVNRRRAGLVLRWVIVGRRVNHVGMQLTNHSGQLSLAIPLWVGATSTDESWGVNSHTARCTSPMFVVSQCKLMSAWLRAKTTKISDALWALWLGKDVTFLRTYVHSKLRHASMVHWWASSCSVRSSYFSERVANIWNSLPVDTDFSSLAWFIHCVNSLELLDFCYIKC